LQTDAVSFLRLFLKSRLEACAPNQLPLLTIKPSASSREGTLLPHAFRIIQSPAQSTRTELTPASQVLELFFYEDCCEIFELGSEAFHLDAGIMQAHLRNQVNFEKVLFCHMLPLLFNHQPNLPEPN
jgi:hypothetical protein